jgi:hypothetical protein
LEGSNLLLANLLKNIGISPTDFTTFGEFFAFLSAKLKETESRIPDWRLVIAFDGLNEAPESRRIFYEALDMVESAREHPWVRIVLSAREEFLFVLWERREGTEANPFYRVLDLFVSPPEDPERPRKPEDPPAWQVPAFSEDQASAVYRRYQQAKAEGFSVPACLTPWENIPPRTRREVLLVPLHINLWMRTFDGKEAHHIGGVGELFEEYLEKVRERFDRFWESMKIILDFMLERGRTELSPDEANEIRQRYSEKGTDFWPLEVACISGVMQKGAGEEGGNYRIIHQRLTEQLFYERLKEKDQKLRPESIREWLSLPPTEELVGALAQLGEDLWEGDRAGELAAFLEEPVGVRALERMLAGRLELREPVETFGKRLKAFLDACGDSSASSLSNLLLFGVPDRVKGLPVTDHLREMWEATVQWIEGKHRSDLARDLGFIQKLGDVYVSLGDTQKALELYGKEATLETRRCVRISWGYSEGA